MGLFKGSPFEVFLVAAADHGAAFTLLAGGLGLVALEALCLAGDASWQEVRRLGEAAEAESVPLRLLDCFRLASEGEGAGAGAGKAWVSAMGLVVLLRCVDAPAWGDQCGQRGRFLSKSSECRPGRRRAYGFMGAQRRRRAYWAAAHGRLGQSQPGMHGSRLPCSVRESHAWGCRPNWLDLAWAGRARRPLWCEIVCPQAASACVRLLESRNVCDSALRYYRASRHLCSLTA